MKKLLIFLLSIFFVSINVVVAKDIVPIKHNELGETIIAIDLDSIKPCSSNTYCVELISYPTDNWTYRDEIPIFKHEIDIKNKKLRLVEVYTRNRKTWKINYIYENCTHLEEKGELKWKNIEPQTLSDTIYMVTYLVGLHGKKYFKDDFFMNN